MNLKFISGTDEEALNLFMWLVDKALHHEAFMQQTAHLKEFKYKMQRYKAQYSHNKMHYNSAKSVPSKMR